MGFQRPHGGEEHRRIWLEPGLAALDVEELLRAQIRAEAGFRHRVVGKLQSRPRRHHRVAAMRDIGERAAMDEGGIAFQRLHQVRSEEHTSELQSLMRTSYAVFCLTKKNHKHNKLNRKRP